MLTGFSLRVIMLKNGIERFFMKKLLISLLVITFALCFVGCGETTTNEDGSVSGKNWQEIQSITYCLQDSKETTLTSSYTFWGNSSDIDEKEYNNAPTNLKDIILTTVQIGINNIAIDKSNVLPNSPSYYNGKSFYYHNENANTYSKFTVTQYNINYVKVHFITEHIFEINYFDGTQFITEKIFPQSYKITYFTK